MGAENKTPIELIGHGSKRLIGRPGNTAHTLDVSALSGVSLYEPAELVLSAGGGTALSEIEDTVAANGQQLAFEPPDLSPSGARQWQRNLGRQYCMQLVRSAADQSGCGAGSFRGPKRSRARRRL